ncbi:MAG: hypothetical protein ACMXYM_00465 [Candidatus Woesearchaeota archaeon]
MVSAAARKGLMTTAITAAVITTVIGAIFFFAPVGIMPTENQLTAINATLLVADHENRISLIRIDEVYSPLPQHCVEPGYEIEAVFTYGIQGGESHGYALPRLEEGSRFSTYIRQTDFCEPPYIGAYSLIE